MGTLPQSRVEPSRPFIHCGVDYAGPLLLRNTVRRGRQQPTKAYIALFVCYSTKAVHLELASDLSSECFIAAFKRFISRRGRPAKMYSDCGTNFKGAQAELQVVHSEPYRTALQTWTTQEGIEWHFNPPSAPHFGGLWEAGVKSTKHHLNRVVGETSLTYEEMSTVLTQVEAILNSRPLCPISQDLDNYDPLTPAHFLIGESLTTVHCPDLTTTPVNRVSRWKMLTKLTQHFWRRWTREYLSRLQQRPKWTGTNPNLKVGDMVLLKEETLPVLQWNLARVIQVHPGPDHLVRVVTVKTSTGNYKRPIAKICKLPFED